MRDVKMLDASGIIHISENLYLVAEDELDHLRVFEFNKITSSFDFTGTVFNLGDVESDFESLACDRNKGLFYATGSFSQDYSKRLVSFHLDDQVLVDKSELKIDTETLLDSDVDIESLCVWHDKLILGYRKPSRGDKAVALVTDTSDQSQLLSSFDLNGRTFRDMDCIDQDNYLILAGPEKGKDYDKMPAQVFWWNGDIVSPQLAVLDLDLQGVRAEGIAVRTSDKLLEVFIGTDESKIKDSQSFRMWYVSAGSLNELKKQKCVKRELSVCLG